MSEIPDLNFVTPVYLEPAKGKLRHIGSAVLLRSTESYWLLTAGHVAAEQENGVVLLPRATGGFLPLQGLPVVSCPSLQLKEAHADPADLFCVALNDGEAGALSSTGVGFLPLHHDTVDADGEIPPGSVGVVWGFPTPSVTIQSTHATVAAAYFADRPFTSPDPVWKMGFDPQQNFGVRMPQKFFRDNVRQHEFQIEGLSGGAIMRSDPDGPRLIGIVTEFYPSQSLLIGSRFRHTLGSVAHHLRSGVPLLKPGTSRRHHPTVLRVEQVVSQAIRDRAERG